MTQMSSTTTTNNLRPTHAERAIGVPGDGAGDAVEIGGPAAAGFELVRGFVERGVAAGAGVDAGGGHVFVVGSCEGGFGAFLAEDAELFCWANVLVEGVLGLFAIVGYRNEDSHAFQAPEGTRGSRRGGRPTFV